MANNTDFLPQIKQKDPPHFSRSRTIVGSGNVVDLTSINTIVNGTGNFVGADTKNVNILGSTDCVVVSGVTNVNIINCSGVVITESDKTFIKDVDISSESFIVSGVTFSQRYHIIPTASYQMTLDDYTVVNEFAGAQITLPLAAGHTQVFNIKQVAVGESGVVPSGSDSIEGVPALTSLFTGDNITLQSDGSTNYIIL